MVYLAVVPALMLGFLAGFLVLKRSSRWCPECGNSLRCVRCAGQPTWEQAARLRARQP
jgi:hypothetical protein